MKTTRSESKDGAGKRRRPVRASRKIRGGGAAARLQAAVDAQRKPGMYLLKLYVAGLTPRSASAIENVKRVCEEHLQGRYNLEVIDLYQQPALAEGEQIVAAPTLVRRLPQPLRKFIGDLSDVEHILVGLDLKKKE